MNIYYINMFSFSNFPYVFLLVSCCWTSFAVNFDVFRYAPTLSLSSAILNLFWNKFLRKMWQSLGFFLFPPVLFVYHSSSSYHPRITPRLSLRLILENLTELNLFLNKIKLTHHLDLNFDHFGHFF